MRIDELERMDELARFKDGKPLHVDAYDEFQMGFGSGLAAGAAWPSPVIEQNGQSVVIDLNSK